MAGKPSLKLVEELPEVDKSYRRLVGELWTSQQRQMHSLHYAVSYRASFKPELPEFCIRRYSNKGDVVLDPFSGRGTTALQANLLGRVAWASDVNPLGVLLTEAKTNPAGLDEIVLRLQTADLCRPVALKNYESHFAPFYHIDTYRELCNLRRFLIDRPDRVNRFIQLLAISRLHGHSNGFFSVYSFPQISVPPDSQRQINRRRRQEPDYRPLVPRIIKKAAQTLRDGLTSDFFSVAKHNQIRQSDARALSWVPSSSVDLIVTSPPFLDKVDYVTDNWLECWFGGIDLKAHAKRIVMSRTVEEWREFQSAVLCELLRVLKDGAIAVIEVGEVDTPAGKVYLDEVVADVALKCALPQKRFVVEEVLVNQQNFTKLANCFSVENNKKGTNTNRLVVLRCSGTPRRSKRKTAFPKR